MKAIQKEKSCRKGRNKNGPKLSDSFCCAKFYTSYLMLGVLQHYVQQQHIFQRPVIRKEAGLSEFFSGKQRQIEGNQGRLPSPSDIHKNCRNAFAMLLTWICNSSLPYNEIHMTTEAKDKAAWRAQRLDKNKISKEKPQKMPSYEQQIA